MSVAVTRAKGGYAAAPRGAKKPARKPSAAKAKKLAEAQASNVRIIKPRTATQARFWSSLAPEQVFASDRGQGKTHSLCVKVHVWASRYANTKCGIVRATLKSCRMTTMQHYREHVLGAELFDAWFNKSDHILTYPNGARVYFLGLDDPTSIKSAEWGILAVDEIVPGIAGGIGVTEQEWIELKLLLRCPNAKVHLLIGATNAGPPTHWLKRREAQGLLEMHEPVTPGEYDEFLPPQYVIDKNSLTGIWKSRYALNQWVSPEGTVFNEFDPAIHCRTEIDPPQGFDFPIGVDFGFNHAFAAVMAWKDGRGRWFVFDCVMGGRGIGMGSKTNEEWGAILNARYPNNRYYPAYCDHSPDGQLTLAKYCPRILSCVNAAKKDELASINTVKALLSARDENGRPMIWFDPIKCAPLIEEMTTLSWAVKRDGEVRDTPVDSKNDTTDALRYLLHSHSGQVAEDMGPRPVTSAEHMHAGAQSVWTSDPLTSNLFGASNDGFARGEMVVGRMG